VSDDEEEQEKTNDTQSDKLLSNFKTISKAISLYGAYKKA